MVRPTTEPLNRRTRRTITGLGSAGSRTITSHSALKGDGLETGTGRWGSETRRYDAFGNVVTSSGIWNGPFGYRSAAKIPPRPEKRGERNESRLVGRNRDAGGFGYQEDATGLKLLGHRYYDSSTGRFLTRDPQKDGRNWFTYCWNDPVGMVDIDGQNPSGLGGMGAAINEAIKRSKEKPGKKEKDPIQGAPAAGEGKIGIPGTGIDIKQGGGKTKVEGSTGVWDLSFSAEIRPMNLKELQIAAGGGDFSVGIIEGGGVITRGKIGEFIVVVKVKDGSWTGTVQGGSGGSGFGLSVGKNGVTWGWSVGF